MVGDSVRSRIAHIDSNGRVTSKFSDMGANAEVRALALRNDTLYIGGDFTGVGPVFSSKGGIIDMQSGAVKARQPFINDVNAQVFASVPDGRGGWFVAGGFVVYQGSHKYANLIHIDSLGNIYDWAPDIVSSVVTMALSGNSLIIGGTFSSVGSVTRNAIAAIDIVTGEATSWNPNVNGAVYTILVKDTIVYIGGSFTKVGGQTRNRLASVHLGTGLVTSWNPNANSDVRALAIAGSKLIIGGAFTAVSSSSRARLASFDLNTGTISAWNPGADNTVYALLAHANMIFAGGNFAQLGGASRAYLGQLDTGSSAATLWNPGPNGPIKCLGLSGNALIFSGSFDQVGTFERKNLASADMNSAAVNGLNVPNTGNSSFGIYFSISGSNIFTYSALYASQFGLGGQIRNKIASINFASGILHAWAPAFDGVVRAIALDGNSVYAGGQFNHVNGNPRDCLAAIDMSTGIVNSWNATAINWQGGGWGVAALLVKDTTLFAGGWTGGTNAYNLAAFHKNTGTLAVSFPKTNAAVYALAIKGNTLYMCGESGVAAMDAGSGAVSTFNAPGSGVRCLSISGNMLYAGGTFSTISGQARKGLAAFDLFSGTCTSWNPNAENDVLTVTSSSDIVFAGGTFSHTGIAGSEKRKNIAAIHIPSGQLLSWNPGANNTVRALSCAGNTLYAGGNFDTIAGIKRGSLVAFDMTNGTLKSWSPTTNNYQINAICAGPSVVFVGGAFSTMGGQSRSRIAALSATTGAATSWNPNANKDVNAITVKGNVVYAGGAFTTIGGQPRNNIAALDITTGSSTSWNPGADSIVYALAVQQDTILAGGLFHTLGGAPRTFVGGVSASTATATSLNMNVKAGASNDQAYAIAVDPLSAYVGGKFTNTAAGIGNLRSFPKTTGTPGSWSGGAGQAVYALTTDKKYLYVGGQSCLYAVWLDTSAGKFPLPVNLPDTVIAFKTDSILLDAGPDFSTYLWNTGSPDRSIWVKNAGLYQVSVTDSSNDTATAYTQVIFVKGIINQDSTLCKGTSLLLTAQSSTSSAAFLWSTGNAASSTTIVPLATTTYYCTIQIGSYTLRDSVKMTIPSIPTSIIANRHGLCGNDSVTLSAPAGAYTYQWYKNQDFVNLLKTTPIYAPSIPGAYQVIVKQTATGCQDTSAVSLVWNYAKPKVKYWINDSTQCFNGHSFAFSDSSSIDSGSLSRTWKFGDGNMSSSAAVLHTYPTAGNYTAWLVQTSDHNCKDSLKQTIVLHANPVAGSITGSAAVPDTISSFTYSVISQPGLTYDWTVSNGTITSGQGTNAAHIRWANFGAGSVTALVTDGAFCTDTSTLHVSIGSLGLKDMTTGPNFQIFPNPNKGQFTISMSPICHSCKYSVFTSTGQEIYLAEIPAGMGTNQVHINVDLSPGLYFLKAEHADGNQIRAFVVE